MITVVVAGNRREFVDWCHRAGRNPFGRDVLYASSVRVIEGLRDFEAVFCGTYNVRKDIQQLEAVLARNLRKQGA